LPQSGALEDSRAGIFAVLTDIGSGFVDEVIDHPGKLLESAAIGVGFAVGATVLAPEIALAAGGLAVAYGSYEVANNVDGWAKAADVVAHSSEHTAEERKAAHDQLHSIGEGLSDLAVGAIGGGVGTIGVKVLKGVATQALGLRLDKIRIRLR
jgi:hypothetical protein